MPKNTESIELQRRFAEEGERGLKWVQRGSAMGQRVGCGGYTCTYVYPDTCRFLASTCCVCLPPPRSPQSIPLKNVGCLGTKRNICIAYMYLHKQNWKKKLKKKKNGRNEQNEVIKAGGKGNK